MVAPNYAASRSALAKEMGLGQERKEGGKKRRAEGERRSYPETTFRPSGIPTRQRGSLSKYGSNFARVSRRCTTTWPSASIPWTRNTDLAMSNPTVTTSPMTLLHLCLSNAAAVMGSRPRHHEQTVVAIREKDVVLRGRLCSHVGLENLDTGTAALNGPFQLMAKWLGILIAAMLAAAVVGFLIDTVRVVATVLFFGCLAVLFTRTMIRLGRRRPRARVGSDAVRRLDRT